MTTQYDTINQSLREEFELSWISGTPLSIERLIPPGDRDGNLGTLEELVRLDLEYSWRSGRNGEAKLERYVDRFPELRELPRLKRLIRREHQIRMTYGDGTVNDSLHERFPELFSEGDTILPSVAMGGDETVVHAPAQDTRGPADDTKGKQPAGGLEETVIPAADVTRNHTGITLPSRKSEDLLGTFGDYELLDVLGKGGMGVVYRARQISAGRDVALKVVRTDGPGSQHSPKHDKAVERFQVEAQAAAKLEHDNIVPVYDVGQVENELFFSMRLVQGTSLRDLVKDAPLDAERAARYLLGAAQGMAAAHKGGILHRDLKPHNVMIDEIADRPLIADFGLAKVVESDQELTRTGEVIGTPSYMPPEQISHAESFQEAGDIYSLGATLYHVLTGRPPFQAANTMATLRLVLYEDAVRPRRLNPGVDRDLETICLKCLQKEPAQRYASMTALVSDLENYLAGKPISARPIGQVERSVRWCRRNPLPASLLGISMLLAASVFLAVLIGYQQTHAALDEAHRNFDLARETVDELYTQVSEVDLEDAPGLQPLKERLLKRALHYYERIIAERKVNGELTSELGLSYFRVGEIVSQIGTLAEARKNYEQAIEVQTKLLQQSPLDKSYQLALSNSWNSLGQVEFREGKLPAAEKAFVQTLELREKLAATSPDNTEYQRKLASIRMNHGLLLASLGEEEKAAESYAAGQQIRQRLMKEESNNANDDIARDFGKGAYNQGNLAASTGEHQQAIDYLRASVKQFQDLVERHPESHSYRFSLALAEALLGDVLQLQKEFDSATEYYGRAHSRLQLLVDDNPRVVDYHEHLASTAIGLAQLQLVRGQTAAKDPEQVQASQQYYESCQRTLLELSNELRRLLDRELTNASVRHNQAVALHMLGDVRLAFQDTQNAHRLFDEALLTCEPLLASEPVAKADRELYERIQASRSELAAAQTPNE